MLDQHPPDSAPLNAGLDEQGVELRIAVCARQNGGKAGDGLAALQHEYPSGGDLLQRYVDGVRMQQQCIAVAGVAQGCAHLQRLEGVAFRSNCRTDDHFCQYLIEQPYGLVTACGGGLPEATANIASLK